ncbi:MAG: outer membrane beta-barrel protein [Granulosicoccaceae bacterium]
MKFSKLTPGLLLLAPLTSQAELNFSPYVGVGFEQQQIEISDTKFENNSLVLQAGAWLWPGIGFEVELGNSLGDDQVSAITLEHSQSLRYGVRLASPAEAGNSVLYVLLSGVASKIDMQTDGNGLPGENSFSGYHAGIGFGTQISPEWLVDISYNNYQIDESFDLSGLRLGLLYTMRGAAQ